MTMIPVEVSRHGEILIKGGRVGYVSDHRVDIVDIL